jgi:ABC-type uncharacterized transport system permease subunit
MISTASSSTNASHPTTSLENLLSGISIPISEQPSFVDALALALLPFPYLTTNQALMDPEIISMIKNKLLTIEALSSTKIFDTDKCLSLP